MSRKNHKLKGSLIPEPLRSIPSPPKELFVCGDMPTDLLRYPRVAIVGSRKITPYGRQVTQQLASTLAKQGIIIISGLAFGVDSVAHQATLEVGGTTIAVLPSSIEEIYPRSHYQLARNIVAQGGVLISEYPAGTKPYRANFIARNRLVAGLSQVVLITEAAEKSGTLHTANFALTQNKAVFCVPGNITSNQSKGTNALIKAGALPVTEAADILQELGLSQKTNHDHIQANTTEEHVVIALLKEGISDGHILLQKSGLSSVIFNQTLTMLEINGLVKPLGNNHWALK